MLSLQLPRAPRTLNKSAHAYTDLRKLFSVKEPISFYWVSNEKRDLVAQIRTGPAIADYCFTLDELNEVCPPLKQILESKVIKCHPGFDYLIETAARTVWKHCSEPSFLVGVLRDKETYSAVPHEISLVDWDNDLIQAISRDYTLTLYEKNGEVVIDDANRESNTTAAHTHRIAAVEEIFPGFSARLKVGVALDLGRVELANYAFATGKNHQNIVTQSHAENEATLPEMNNNA